LILHFHGEKRDKKKKKEAKEIRLCQSRERKRSQNSHALNYQLLWPFLFVIVKGGCIVQGEGVRGGNMCGIIGFSQPLSSFGPCDVNGHAESNKI
jgi:hypothetical protein